MGRTQKITTLQPEAENPVKSTRYKLHVNAELMTITNIQRIEIAAMERGERYRERGKVIDMLVEYYMTNEFRKK
jgi:hypothetical protein